MVFENSPDIILLLDKNGAMVYCADVFLQRANIPSFEDIRKTHYADVFSIFSSPNQLQEIDGIFETARLEKRSVVFERSMDIGNEGKLYHYGIHFTPMYDETGDFQGAFILFHDMTNIIMAKERLEQASSAKSHFLASMSHEIRTPLNAIIGMTSIATDSPDPERKNYCLGKISGASTHLLGIINDILDMSKIEEGKFELSNTEFNFSAMLQRVKNIFEFLISQKKQNFIMDADPLIPARIISDEQRLAQVITNLLSNAVKFTPDGGTIGLTAKRVDSKENLDSCTLELRVSDTGIGISKKEQSKLFNSFVQVDSSISRKYGGTGLGLAISKGIVEMMHGDIRIESESGRGTTFIVTIVAEMLRQTVTANDNALEELESAADGKIDFGGKNILLVEDVEINREIVIALLEDYNINITEAENGWEAFDKICAHPEFFDLIFMDIHMPGVDGYESTKLIRAIDNPHAKEIPIIAMTANVFKEDVANCLAAGMNSHIGKPLDFDEVMAILNKYLIPKADIS